MKGNSKSPERGSVYFKNLDSIRFFAALMVYLQHGISRSYQYLDIQGSVLWKFLVVISSGDTGVSIFFVLSGFLITYLLISEHELYGKIDVKKFYIRRFLRIWPLYYAVVIFGFILYPGIKSALNLNTPLDSNPVYYFVFLSNFDVIRILSQGPGFLDAMSQNITWSVAIEEQYYLFWPLLFLAPKRFWIIGIASVLATSIIFRLLNNNEVVLYFHTLAVFSDLAIGGFFAYLIKRFALFRRYFESAGTVTHLVFIGLIIAILYFETEWLFGEYNYAFSRILNAICFGLLISAQAITRTASVLNLSNITFANYWGKYTYGIYLLHPIVILLTDVSARIIGITQDNFSITFGLGLLGFAGTLLLSWLSYHYYERRFLLLKKKYQIVRSRAN